MVGEVTIESLTHRFEREQLSSRISVVLDREVIVCRAGCVAAVAARVAAASKIKMIDRRRVASRESRLVASRKFESQLASSRMHACTTSPGVVNKIAATPSELFFTSVCF
jgi:hypothetical protein